ncbi:BNR/Asp-box repeat protein [compost metagenome]
MEISTFAANTLAHSDTCLYLGSQFTGFYKSNDGGISWTPHKNGLPADTVWGPSGQFFLYKVTDIEVSENYIFCGTDEGVYRNNVQLTQWASINSGLPLEYVTLIKEFNDTLYTVIANSLYRSINDGTTWSTLYTSPSAITSLEIHNHVIYVSTTSSGIIRSLNNGANWNSINTGLTDLNVNTLSSYGNNLLCGTHSKGVFYLQNGQWINDQPGMVCSVINSMTATNSHLISDDHNKVYKYQSNGNWNDISPTVTYDFFSSLASKHDSVFLSVEYNTESFPNDSPFILFSPDNGVSWSNLINPVPFAEDDPYQIYFEDGKLYARENEKMSYTSNLGASWTNINLTPPLCNGFNGFIVYNSTPYATACSNGQVIKLNNNQNWVQSSTTGLPYVEPSGFASCDGALFIKMGNNGMYVSFDNGNTWSHANNGLPANQYIYDFVNRGSELYIASTSGIFGTHDFGQNWFSMNHGLKNLNIWSVEIQGDTLFAGTRGNGIWKLGLTDLNLGLDDYSEQAVKLYPNPATDQITIENSAVNAEYQIVDLFGKKIISGHLNAGNKISTSELKNGTYLVVIQTENTVSSKKLIISR